MPKFIIGFLLLFAGQLHAQESLRLPKLNVGVGFGVDAQAAVSESGLDPSWNMAIKIPLLFRRTFKLEPEIGFALINSNDDLSFNLGIGGFYNLMRDRLGILIGVQAGFSYASLSGSAGQDQMGFSVGPALGIEYYLSQQFSIGGQIQVAYSYLDEPKVQMFTTRAGLYLRFYLSKMASPKKSSVSSDAEPRPTPKLKSKPDTPQAEIETAKSSESTTSKKDEVPEIKGPVVQTPNCPEGTSKIGKAPPRGWEQYCGSADKKGKEVKQGWYLSWYDNGQIASQGDYRKNQRHGKWTFLYSNGKKRLEAEYQDGQKSGRWIYWSKTGEKKQEIQH